MNLRSPFLALAVVITGIVSFGGYIVLSAYAPALRQGDEAAAHALSRSAIGYRALGDLLEASGHEVLRLRSSPDASTRGARVLTPSFGALNGLDLKDDGPTLVILPKWYASQHPTKRGWAGFLGTNSFNDLKFMVHGEDIIVTVDRRGSTRSETEEFDDAEQGAPDDDLDDVETVIGSETPDPELITINQSAFGQGQAEVGAISWFQSIGGDAIEPLWVDQQGKVVLGRLSNDNLSHPVFILSDPDLVNTQGLASRERALSAIVLFSELAGEAPVVFDLTLNGFMRPRNIITLATQPPLLGVTAASFLATTLLAGLAFQRFGAPKRDERGFAAGHEALVGATANLLLSNNKASALGQMYADQLRQDLRHRHHHQGEAEEREDDWAAFERSATEASTSKDLDEALNAARKLFERKRIIENE